MRLLLYGLQNSGATLVALFAGQRTDSIVLPDLWTMYCAPAHPFKHDVCIKATITESFPLEQHLAAFKPDCTLLVVRRPIDNYLSLQHKTFANHDGLIEQKFARANAAFNRRDRFDGFVVLEDFLGNPSALQSSLGRSGWALPDSASEFARTALEMETFIWQNERPLYARAQWGTGQARIQPLSRIRPRLVNDVQAADFCLRYCPDLHAFYEKRFPSCDGAIEHRAAQDESQLQFEPNVVRNLVALFESSLRAGDAVLANTIADEICGIVPQTGPACDAKARALELAGQTAQAGALLRAAVEHNTDPAEAGSLTVALARHALRSARFADAISIAACVPANASAHLVVAEAALRLRDFSTLEKNSAAALQLEPRNVNARRLSAEALVHAGRRNEAIEMLQSCLAITPEYEPARRRLAELRERPPQP